MEQNRQLAKNLIFNTISFGINFIISFFFTPYLVRTVGKDAYSFFPLVNNIIGYSMIITTAVGSMAGRFVTMRFYKKDFNGANEYFNSIWVANVVLSVFFTILAILGVIHISRILTVPRELEHDVQWLVFFGSLTLILGLLTSVLGLGTFVKNRLDMQASRTVVTNIIRIACIFLLFFVFKPTIVFMSLSAFIAAIVGVIFNISFKRKLLPELTFAPTKYFSWIRLKEVISSGFWNSLTQLSNVLLGQIDLLITNLFVGVAATGNYAIAKMAPMLILQLLAMLSGTFIPHFNILLAKDQMEHLVSEVSKSMILIGLLIGVPIGCLAVFSQEFFELWVPGQDSRTLYWLCFLTVIPLICGGSVNPIYGIFTVTNKLKIPSLVVLISSSLQTVVILIVINFTELGIWSIPIVAGVQAVLRNSLFTPIYGALCLNKKWYAFFPTLFRGILGMLVVIGVGLIIKPMIQINCWLDLFVALSLVVFLSLSVNVAVIAKKSERDVLLKKVKKYLKSR